MNRVIIPEHDFAALRQLDCDMLQDELDRAEIVPGYAIPIDVVTMHARVRYVDETTGERRDVTLVYPEQTDVARGRISVLAPVGAALLGLSAGDAIEWVFPHGARRRLRVESVEQAPAPERRLARAGSRRERTDDDDPGPLAA
jgi:regulator of nucleoside diphosphate kinase